MYIVYMGTTMTMTEAFYLWEIGKAFLPYTPGSKLKKLSSSGASKILMDGQLTSEQKLAAVALSVAVFMD